jgi:hypothetical protein
MCYGSRAHETALVHLVSAHHQNTILLCVNLSGFHSVLLWDIQFATYVGFPGSVSSNIQKNVQVFPLQIFHFGRHKVCVRICFRETQLKMKILYFESTSVGILYNRY